MLRISFRFFTSQLILITILSTIFINAQWVSDPSTNLMVCDLAGEQALSKIVSTSDGGCYISWFDSRTGNYEVYLQRLDPLGFKMWADNGLLISGNPQNSWLVDYDLLADHNDNAVVVFSDIRNGGNLNVFAYKISPAGDFLWGANGVGLSTTTDFQPNPKVTETEDGNFVVAWIVSAAQSQVALQKLSADGTILWGSSPVLIQSAAEGYGNPDVVPTTGGGVIAVYTSLTGNFPAQVVKLRAQKFDSNGAPEWGANGVGIQEIGGISAWHVPIVWSDGLGGAFTAWHDDRDFNNLYSAFVQRVSPSGSLFFPADGVELSIAAGRNKFYPQIAFDSASRETFAFWVEADANQSQNGISGQKLSVDGSRLWGNSGLTFKPLGAPNSASISSLNVQRGNDRNYIIYLEGTGSGLDTKVEGFSCDGSGNFLWTGSFVTLSTPTQEKLQMESTVDANYNCKVSWGDKRLDGQGIYAQDINPNGELGNSIVPVELISFSGYYSNGAVNLKWTTASETNNKGFEIERKLAGGGNFFEVIGFVQGGGTSTEENYYYFSDELIVETSPIRYRLKQIDFDGSYNYSNEILIDINIQPTDFTLEQNFPNPFNPSATIGYSIPEQSWVTLKIINLLGEEVAELINESKPAGNYKIKFHAKDLPSGIYFYRLETEAFISTKKMILLR